jgi:SAM-dependent methyltransferase
MGVIRTAKEMARDLIAKAGLSRLDVSIRKLRGQNVDHLFRTSLAERFSAVYENRVWLNGRPTGSLSGFGSELENTETVRHHLAELLESLKARSFLDIGCGDFTWMKEIVFPHRYIGVDIVRGVIEKNNALYSSALRSFAVMDATRDPLPGADMVLCREVLFHLSFRDIWRLVANIRRSGSLFLVATSDGDIKYNADILSGDFRMLNLRRAPFRFAEPTLSIPDNRVSPHRTLSAWRVVDLPEPCGALKGVSDSGCDLRLPIQKS